MKLAVLALALVACNQRDSAKQAPPAPAPAPAPKVALAPPDADVYEAEVEPPPDAATAAVADPHDPHRPDPGKAVDDRNEAAMEEEAKRYADLLTADSPNGTTGADMDTRRRPGADLNQQINDVKDSNQVVAIGGGTARPGTRTGESGGVSGPGGGTLTAIPASGPSGRISISSKQAFDETTLSPDAVLAKITQVYMAGIKRCYRDELKVDPTARGKVALKLTVNETGRAVGGTADTFDAALTTCIGGLMAAWRFPVPKDADGEATEAAFQITLQLVPE